MSKTFSLPLGVNSDVDRLAITLTGPKGKLCLEIPSFIQIESELNKLYVSNSDKGKKSRTKFGTFCTNLKNVLKGISNGHSVQLNLVGVGYRAESTRVGEVTLKLGYSKPILMKQDPKVDIDLMKPTILQVKGCNIQKVAQKAAIIRRLRYPEPYKGKGILIKGETILRKEGKKLS